MFITTEGFKLRDLAIPRFTLHSGAVITVAWPGPMGGKEELMLYQALTGQDKVDGLRVGTRAAIATPHGLSVRAASLREAWSSCPNDTVLLQTLQEHQAKYADTKLGDLPYSIRVIVAVAIACTESQVVVLTVAGLDVSGEDKVLAYVQAKAREGWSFVVMRFPCVGDAQAREVAIRVLSLGSQGAT